MICIEPSRDEKSLDIGQSATQVLHVSTSDSPKGTKQSIALLVHFDKLLDSTLRILLVLRQDT